jgi:hypothetical protein
VKWIPIIISTPKILLIIPTIIKIPIIIKTQINFPTNILKTYLILVLHQISTSHPLFQTFIHIICQWLYANGYMPMVNGNLLSGGAPEFPEFSTQITIGGMIVANEVTPNSEDSTSKSKKNQQPAWNT